jgi:glutathione-specific gamma-glutamylcyclotransferase
MAMPRPRQLDLTADLVARVDRVEPDSPDADEMTHLTPQEFDELTARLLAENGPGPLWVFGYGSLIWKPEIAFDERRIVHVHGFRRAFNLPLLRWRGTPEQPGLMLAADSGGSFKGVALRIPAADAATQLRILLVRELAYQADVPAMRWVTCRSGADKFRALTSWIRFKTYGYFVDLPIEEQAARLARAAGHLGSGAAYLHNTVSHLEEMGIHDRYLWKLQKLVADEIRRMPPRA